MYPEPAEIGVAMTTGARSMKSDMPTTFAWLQDLRAAFGPDSIDPQIRGALRDGLPSFHAREGGHEAGVPLPAARTLIAAGDMVIISPQEDVKHAGRR